MCSVCSVAVINPKPTHENAQTNLLDQNANERRNGNRQNVWVLSWVWNGFGLVWSGHSHILTTVCCSAPSTETAQEIRTNSFEQLRTAPKERNMWYPYIITLQFTEKKILYSESVHCFQLCLYLGNVFNNSLLLLRSLNTVQTHKCVELCKTKSLS